MFYLGEHPNPKMAEEVAVEQQPVAVESKKRKRQPKAKPVEGQEEAPKVVKQKKQKQSQQQQPEKVYSITESSLKEAQIQQSGAPKEVAAKKEKKVRPKKRPEDIHSIPLDQLVSSTILALCMPSRAMVMPSPMLPVQ